jgi:hypothetical protein
MGSSNSTIVFPAPLMSMIGELSHFHQESEAARDDAPTGVR